MRKKSHLFVLAVVIMSVGLIMTDSSAEYICGDANSDGTLNVSDAVYIINHVFVGGPAPDPDCCEFGGASVIVIDASPDSINAPWSLTGPDGYSASGNGDDFRANLYGGNYTISWGAVAAWSAPPDTTLTLADTAIVTFVGIYEEATGTVTDIDGNVYQTIKIGDQWWMAENLKVTHYRNGDPIPHVTDNSAWGSLSTGAYCNYDNDEGNVITYGRLYNGFAVNDSRDIAPEGWHVPTDVEWKQLEMYLGMSQVEADAEDWRGTDEGGKLKEAGTTHWQSPNYGATNESGFTALPGGYRPNTGEFLFIGEIACFWSSTESDGLYLWYRILSSSHSDIGRYSGGHKRLGFSVRCVKD